MGKFTGYWIAMSNMMKYKNFVKHFNEKGKPVERRT